jgi:hypothetical protein
MHSVFTGKGLIVRTFIGHKTAQYCLYDYDGKTLIKHWGSLVECLEWIYEGRQITYHRPPTKGEIRSGYGATHYKDFNPYLCAKKDGSLKKWFVCPEDGLRYYR